MHKRLSKYIILLSLLNGVAYSQIPSVNGDFEISTNRGCIDLDVTVNNLTSPLPDEVVVYSFYGLNPDSITTNTTNTYRQPGTYWVYQVIQTPSGGTGKADSVQVEVFDNPPPAAELLTCNNNQVIVNITDTFYDIYRIDYGDGSPILTVNTGQALPYSYLTTGPFSVSITGIFTSAPNNCGSTVILFDPLAQVAPAFISAGSVLTNAEYVLDYQLAPNSLSYLEYSINSAASFQTVKQLAQNTLRDTLNNLDVSAESYCFRIATYDACSNFRSYSNLICSIDLSTTAVNNSINLSWTTETGVPATTFNINRDTTLLTSVAGTNSTYNDSTVVCGLQYCYTIEADYGNGSVSRSISSCQTAFSTDQPLPPEEISSVRDANQTTYHWLQSTSASASNTYIYTLQNGSYQLFDSTNQASYTISNPQTCIRLANSNNCGLTSQLSSVACPMTLSVSSFETGNVALNWSLPDGWSIIPSEFAVVIYNEDFSVRDSILVSNQQFYVDLITEAPEQFAYYTVYALSPFQGLISSRSEIIPLVRTPQILLPNAFTPNNDGLNDRFVVNGKFIDSSEINIFNRWGSLIFSSSDSSGWDGSTNGAKVPLGNYTYKVVVKDFTGNEHIRTGSILILSH